MEVPQGNSLYSYLKQPKMSFFFFYKIREQEDETGPAWGERCCWYWCKGRGSGERVQEGEYGATTVYT
jgi:hypothetical protein